MCNITPEFPIRLGLLIQNYDMSLSMYNVWLIGKSFQIGTCWLVYRNIRQLNIFFCYTKFVTYV
jgi:hypothetical protein